MNDYHTLPTLANQWNVSVDVLRKFLHANPKLTAGGILIGATRCFPPATAKRIKQAFDARVTRRSSILVPA